MFLTMESSFSLHNLLSRAKCLLLYQTPWFVLQDEWKTRAISTVIKSQISNERAYKPELSLVMLQVSRSFSTSFREYFSPFLHSTCMLSVSNHVFSLWSTISPMFKIQLQGTLLMPGDDIGS